MSKCTKCGTGITADEVGLFKKLVSRTNPDCLCVKCVAEYFGADTEFLKRKIIHFKRMGCMLFTPYNPETDIETIEEEN